MKNNEQNNLSDKPLLLFDVDGTLVDWHPENRHHQAFAFGLSKVYKIDKKIDIYPGMTDRGIITENLQKVGMAPAEISAGMEDCIRAMAEFYLEEPDKNVALLPGVEDLLQELEKREYLMGLVTGNVKEIAFAKLGVVGLDRFFNFGGFGSEDIDRSRLVRRAIKRAEKFGHNGQLVYVFDDTVRGCAAGKKGGAKTIAIATGDYSIEDLEQGGADYVLDNLKNKAAVLEIIEK